MNDSTRSNTAQQRIVKQLERIVEERSTLGQAFEAYVGGTLTSSDCSTLVDVVLQEFVQQAKVSPRGVALLEMVADAVAQLANRDAIELPRH